MPKGDYSKTKEFIVPLRGVVRNGTLAALLDHEGVEVGGLLQSSGVGVSSVFAKQASGAPAFVKLSADALAIKAGTAVGINGGLLRYDVDTVIVMPALIAGTDYAIFACSDGSVRASSTWSAPAGYTPENSRRIGGFHYAPGGNAMALAGGDAVPAINEYSLWDLSWRPVCQDPRGMTLVAGGFWADIYLLGVNHVVDGTSRYNVTIADGSSPPRVPPKFGGDGSAIYSSLNWWVAAEVMRSHGKRLPDYGEFAALAYGSTEQSSSGADPVSTLLRAPYISRWGVMLATGNLWVWGNEFGGGAAGAGYTANTGGRGSTYQMENAALFGGNGDHGAYSGSRASVWNFSPSHSNVLIGARGVCDHLIRD